MVFFHTYKLENCSSYCCIAAICESIWSQQLKQNDVPGCVHLQPIEQHRESYLMPGFFQIIVRGNFQSKAMKLARRLTCFLTIKFHTVNEMLFVVGTAFHVFEMSLEKTQPLLWWLLLLLSQPFILSEHNSSEHHVYSFGSVSVRLNLLQCCHMKSAKIKTSSDDRYDIWNSNLIFLNVNSNEKKYSGLTKNSTQLK